MKAYFSSFFLPGFGSLNLSACESFLQPLRELSVAVCPVHL
jgi:hypothetical protein